MTAAVLQLGWTGFCRLYCGYGFLKFKRKWKIPFKKIKIGIWLNNVIVQLQYIVRVKFYMVLSGFGIQLYRSIIFEKQNRMLQLFILVNPEHRNPLIRSGFRIKLWSLLLLDDAIAIDVSSSSYISSAASSHGDLLVGLKNHGAWWWRSVAKRKQRGWKKSGSWVTRKEKLILDSFRWDEERIGEVMLDRLVLLKLLN